MSEVKNRGKETLEAKIAKLDPGKVLDVSKISETGAGVVAIKRPTTARSTKFSGGNLPIVSSNLEHYLLAIDHLPGGRVKYAAEIRDFESKLSGCDRSVSAVQVKITPFEGTIPFYTPDAQLTLASTPYPDDDDDGGLVCISQLNFDSDSDDDDSSEFDEIVDYL